MIDHLLGRPSPSWKRTQVFLVIIFWLWRILFGNPGAPRILWLRRMNRSLKRYTPWQLIVSTLCGVYAARNLDKVLGFGAPEPLARLYSPSYYRATWISTGLDAGFATAMSIRPKWLRDICSVLFSAYYVVYANEAEEKIRKFRAVPTVEMLRTTWEKTTNPYIRLVTNMRLPRMTIRRKILLPRPESSTYERPITAYLYFALPEHQLYKATDLILDYPGGGFVAMTPEHHEERLRIWAWRTGKPVLSIEYGKAPEYPYPFAIDEAFDTYRVLVESKGLLIGMSGKKFNTVLSGDSAGATLAVGVMIKILEHNSSPSRPAHPIQPLPKPLALVLNYAALDFNFTSWMSPSNLRVLRSEQSSGNLPGLEELVKQKDHLGHVSPLSMVGDRKLGSHRSRSARIRRQRSWRDTLRDLTGGDKAKDTEKRAPQLKTRHSTTAVKTYTSSRNGHFTGRRERANTQPGEDRGSLADAESEDDEPDLDELKEEERPIQARVRYVYPHSSPNPTHVLPTASTLEKQQEELSAAIAEADCKANLSIGGKANGQGKVREPIGTRLTMTSRTGYFQDRIISPSMMRAMAILYIGPHRNPDFATDYHISPILAPSHLLAQFPPLLMQCGEKDPFVDDTVIFAGRVREAKRARKTELDLAIAGKSARFGEGLRMSLAGAEESSPIDSAQLSVMKAERDRLAGESEEDWVQMVLFSDWSHGYLQMPSLMKEAAAAIEELGEWIDDTFRKHSDEGAGLGEDGSLIPVLTGTPGGSKKVKVDSHPTSFLQAPARTNGTPTRSTAPPSPFTSETETDDSMITFIPKRHHRSRQGSSENEHVDAKVLSPIPDTSAAPRSDSSGSDKTLHDDANIPHAALPPPFGLIERPPKSSLDRLTPSDHVDSVTSPRPTDHLMDEADAKALRSPGRLGTPSKTGQTITETELMRRRRLLDAHIFD